MRKFKNILKLFIIAFLILTLIAGGVIYKRNMHIWLPDYVRWLLSNTLSTSKDESPKHIIFLFVDHFEPYFRTDSDSLAEERIQAWITKYPKIASKHKDADGRHPQHVWFYPQEEIRKDLNLLKRLASLSLQGFGEVEMHLHHSNDTSELFGAKIDSWKKAISSVEGNTRIYFGYIAGNWALDNSRLEHGKNYSGVNNELEILKESGCYADFTFPSVNQKSQPAKVNSIYYAIDNPIQPKSYNRGIDVAVGKEPRHDLLIAQGPLVITRYPTLKGLKPSIDDGNICDTFPPFKERVDTWINCNIHVKGQPNWIFVKIFTHGCEDETIPIVLGKPMDDMFAYLEKNYNDGKQYVLHYVTAREFYNIIKAAEAGKKGNPGEYRDYIIKPYIKKIAM